LKNRQPLFYVGILAFPLGILLMTYFARLYFIGIVGLFLLILFQTPNPTKVTDEEKNKRSMISLRQVTFIVITYLLGGFVSMVFL